ncbi:CspA family cold shock protein [Bradyrhizobium sp. LB1.3]
MEQLSGYGDSEVVQPPKGYGSSNLTTAARMYLSISPPFEKAGLSSLNEGAKVSFDVVNNRGKDSAGNLRMG